MWNQIDHDDDTTCVCYFMIYIATICSNARNNIYFVVYVIKIAAKGLTFVGFVVCNTVPKKIIAIALQKNYKESWQAPISTQNLLSQLRLVIITSPKLCLASIIFYISVLI